MRVAVIGAGLSGLTAALRLQQRGHAVTVFERGLHPGGRMATVHRGGFALDVGANLLLDNYVRLRALALEVGIGDQWMPLDAGGRGGILDDGEIASIAPTSLSELLRPPGLSWTSRLRVLAFFLRQGADETLDFFDLSAGDDALDEVDAWTGIAAACGEDVVRQLVDPFVRTFHFHSARHLSMKVLAALAALFSRERGFRTFAFRGYMEALPRAIAARVPVRLGVEAGGVRPVGAGVEVDVDGVWTGFDAAVVATTAGAARRLLVAPTGAQEAVLAGARTVPTMVCAFRVPLVAVDRFEGVWIPWEESAIISNCANETCKGSTDGQDCVLSLGLHEEAARLLSGVPDEVVLGLVAHEWGRFGPASRGRMTPLHVHRWAEAMPRYGVGDLRRVKAFWASGQGEGGIWLCGDWLNHPWLEGAVRCGERVAAAIGG